MKTVLCDCPVCKGSGKFKLPYGMEIDSLEIKTRLTKELRKKGYSIRQIQIALGYKSPRSISKILETPEP